jgi:SAM-dependent methyltransferase
MAQRFSYHYPMGAKGPRGYLRKKWTRVWTSYGHRGDGAPNFGTIALKNVSFNDRRGAGRSIRGPMTMSSTIELFPLDYDSGGAEVRKSYEERVKSGFFSRFFSGPRVLDIGFKGADNPNDRTIVPHAIGVDVDYPGYDGARLPFIDNSIDTVSSSHCIEHIWFVHAAIRDWYRVLRIGGFIVCFAPHQYLYEKRDALPSVYNPDHKRLLTPAGLLGLFEEALEPNSYRIRHFRDNDKYFNYDIGPLEHSFGCYEMELVIEKLAAPKWTLFRPGIDDRHQ